MVEVDRGVMVRATVIENAIAALNRKVTNVESCIFLLDEIIVDESSSICHEIV